MKVSGKALCIFNILSLDGGWVSQSVGVICFLSENMPLTGIKA
jgi:hypothetical protein